MLQGLALSIGASLAAPFLDAGRANGQMRPKAASFVIDTDGWENPFIQG
jgi:hypothetical protein